jgi:NADP-dependent 3-hydroxy acid dehydrogenase YdfG
MQNKEIILVTGASSGMGRETAIKLAKEGYIVYAAARRLDKLNELKEYG